MLGGAEKLFDEVAAVSGAKERLDLFLGHRDDVRVHEADVHTALMSTAIAGSVGAAGVADFGFDATFESGALFAVVAKDLASGVVGAVIVHQVDGTGGAGCNRRRT